MDDSLLGESLTGLYLGHGERVAQDFDPANLKIDDIIEKSPELRIKKKRQSTSGTRKSVMKKMSFNYLKQNPDQLDQKMFKQRTILLTTEIEDNLSGLLNYDLVKISKFSIKQAQISYKILMRSSKPIFSGSVDHRINLLDSRKVLPIMQMNPDQVGKIIQ